MPASNSARKTENFLEVDSRQKDLRSDAGVGFCILDATTQILTLDSVARRHYGLSEDVEVNTGLVLECLHPDDREHFAGMFYKAGKLKGEKLRHRVPLGDGKFRYLEMFIRLSESNCFYGILLDVTESMEAHLELEQERQRFEVVAAGVPGRYCYLGPDTSVRFMSTEMRKALNLLDVDTTGILTSETLGADVWEERKAYFARALEGETVVWQRTSVDPDGFERHDIVTYQPNVAEDGEVLGVFSLHVDITEIHQLEMALRETQSNLQRSNKDLEQFAYVASHDLKAPLRAIQVLVEWLQEDLEGYDEGDVQENIGLLGKRASRLSVLLDDLLAYSRAGRQAEKPSAIDLCELVSEIVELNGQAEGDIVCWQGENSPVLQTDHAALHQVMRNLIGNAVKHHPGPDCQVRISAQQRDELIEITVEDNGEGIKPEFSEKIFQMFQTLKPRDDVEGSGMGLAIVQRLVNHHGGDIWFEVPQSGVGTAFKFTWRPEAVDSR